MMTVGIFQLRRQPREESREGERGCPSPLTPLPTSEPVVTRAADKAGRELKHRCLAVTSPTYHRHQPGSIVGTTIGGRLADSVGE